jgi:hypothetical protein
MPEVVHDLQVVMYKGAPHLSFIQATQFNGYARGHGVILDNTYTVVKRVESGNKLPGIDQHEFWVVEGGETALISIYSQAQVKTSISKMTWVNSCIFQDVNIETGNVNFEWHALDWVPTNMSFVPPRSSDIAGDGLTNDTAWDYLLDFLILSRIYC